VAEDGGAAIWSPEALSDLDEIWSYYERVAGRDTALKIIRQIGDVIAILENHPFAGRARDELRAGIRSLAATPHVVFYRVTDDVPEIIRILDSRRDIDEIFSD
jgi:toxin ParE1/3/4